MDRSPYDHTTGCSFPLQARALRFLKKLALRARGASKKSGDVISPVAIPHQDFQRAHSSVDLSRMKPDISRLIGLPHPMDADDSSQDVSAGSNSPRSRPRRHSTWDSLRTSPVHYNPAGYGATLPFLRDHPGSGDDILAHDSGDLPTPTSLLLRSSVSLEAVVQPPRSPVSIPEILPQIRVVQDMPNDVTPRPSGDIFSHNFASAASLTHQAPTTCSEQDNLSKPLTLDTIEHAAPNGVSKRPSLGPRRSAPSLASFRVTTERRLRLSPSIITRQPMPILNLPALPTPPATPDTSSRPKIPLRNMPSLTRSGRIDSESQADPENATLAESDEEDGDECEEEEEQNDALSVPQSDEEDDEPPSAGLPGVQGFKSWQKRRMSDDERPLETPVFCESPPPDFGPSPADYFSSGTSDALSAYPFSLNMLVADDINRPPTVDSDHSKPSVWLENKPSLHRVASRSMIDLGSTRRTERGVSRLQSRETVLSNQGTGSENHAESEESQTEAMIGRLMRRNSMPSFHPTSDPPPYPTFDPRPKESRVIAREDEGRERLPPYTNSLYLIAIMPRKMEFSSPGVQAKDRKWRRIVCELEGTTFRVYKCPPGASGGGVLGDWWEKRVGVGDMASPGPSRPRKREEEYGQPGKLEANDLAPPSVRLATPGRSMSVPPTRDRRQSQSSMATQQTMASTPRPAKRMSGASFLSPFRSSSSVRPEASTGEASGRPEPGGLELLPVDVQDNESSASHESAERATPTAQRFSQTIQPRSGSRLSFFAATVGRTQSRNEDIRKPPESDLLRAYTLQHAESGLGNDYLKRKNVIRVRTEGEQFLLQAPDVSSVVEWIEGLHAGTNIALDLDQRLMPRGPMFPRRRRRRVRRVEEVNTTAS